MEIAHTPLAAIQQFSNKIIQAASPLDLKTAPAITLGSTLTDPVWDAYVNLHRRPDRPPKKDSHAHELAYL